MTPQTRLPPYLPIPRFLLKCEISFTAKVIYGLLLSRMTLSQKNGWTDEYGHSYILYPLEKLSEDMDRSQTTVKSALAELTAYGLIERVRNGFSGPNRIYLLLPDSRNSDLMTDGKPALTGTENCPSYSRKTDSVTVGKLTDNYMRNNDITERKERVNVRSRFGKYKNVLLTEEEYSDLKAEFPDADRLIEKLSVYMKSSGRTYADHAATLRLWYERDKPEFPDYTPIEGESL